ncbi:XdhC family protein [Mucilaginibacter gilvus]|uniref:XdhC/CoxI family protein n=1 Tax=Mucilaginibacter gilvus TaxID=2305909 RepID=A0A3S4Y5N5_9SPHI|nr:XdhC/CoxI family protein [Mucilaginibacter gilvus]RWY47987.1 XdhC/CoxI family protein [Mucilaginibacter gilvus]
MKELIDIVAAYDIAAKQGKKTALATVVQVEGSAYRRAGARMLITEDGQLTGAISGGCLEGDALRKARLVILQQEPMLVTYDTTDDDDAKLGVGLGCNGIIHILIEPISGEPNNPIRLLKTVVNGRRNAVLVTLFSVEDRKAPQPGTCLSLTENELLLNRLEGLAHQAQIIDDAKRVMADQRSETKFYNNGITYTAFVEFVKPLISLVVVGAGNDAIPLTKLAAVLGWDTTVIDGRPNYALPERFPSAQKIIVAKPGQALSHISINEHTAFVLMTHNYNYELALLKELLPLQLSYVGVLGPKKKLARLLAEIEDSGQQITEEQLKNIYGPVGLDIGSEGAEEIALSIVAEIKAVLSKRKGNSLKYKPASIHAPHLATIG